VVVVVFAIVAMAIAFWHRKERTSGSAGQHAGSQHVATGQLSGGGMATDLATATRRVSGTVFLEDTPAPGATVRLVRERDATETSVKTDVSGRFDLGAVVVGRYLVVAEVAHATGAMSSIDLRNPNADPPPGQLRLVAHACDAILHGVIRDASGGTIAKARIAQSEGVAMGPGTDSAADGSYELCIAVGDSSVTIRADGYADTTAPVSVFGKVRRDFELVPEAIVAGRAVRADDGRPVAGARIELRSERPAMDHPMGFHATSDADGRFRFQGVAASAYKLRATAAGLATKEDVDVVADVATPAENVTCSLVGAFSIAGRVADHQKKPISGARLYALLAHGAGWSRDAVTQADGSFVIDSVLPGEYVIGTQDYAVPKVWHEVKVENANVDHVMLEVGTFASIAGRVTRAGKPVEGASVSTRSTTRPKNQDELEHMNASAITDADGRFVLGRLLAGTYRVYAESKRVGAFTQGPEVTIADAEAKKGVEVDMNLAGAIAGTVVDQSNVPVSGVQLRFSLLHGTDFGQATTAEDGTFKATALSGGGDYTYEVRGMTASDIPFRSADGKRFPPISVKDGNTQVTGVVIKIRYDRLTITGRVLSSAGTGAPDVSITVLTGQDFMERGWAGPSATTDESGAFIIRDLPAGTYALRARAATVSKRVEGVSAGSKGVEIRLPAFGTIEGTIVGFAKTPEITAYGGDDLPYMMMSAPPRAVVTGTHFVFAKLVAGSYHIVARSEDGYASAKVTISGTTKVTVDLENKGLGTVEGRVTDESKAPVAGLECNDESFQSATTDSNGAFRLEHVAVGSQEVRCFGKAGMAEGTVTVQVNATAHIDLVAKARAGFGVRGYSGLELESQLEEVVVKSVAARSPSERAGLKVGDVIKSIDGEPVEGDYWGPDEILGRIETRASGATAKLTIERNDKDQPIEIKIDPPRNP
jgi:hypothetical protein